MSRFAVRRVRSAPAGLAEALPLTAHVVAVRHRADGLAFFCAVLDEPLVPTREIPLDRPVRHIVVTSGAGAPAPHAGMRDHPVELALVVDDTLLDDEGIDPAKILPVGVVEIDDVAEAAASGIHDEAPTPPAPDIEDVLRRLDDVTATLRALSAVDDTPSYGHALDVDGGAFVVTVHDAVTGPSTRRVTDADDALGLLATDVAGELAWAWAQRTPTLHILDAQAALRAVWLPYWHVLAHAVSPAWAESVRDIIRRAYADPTLTLTPPHASADGPTPTAP